MSSRNAKRKRWSTIKDVVMHDLHNLAIESAEFNNNLQEASDFFVEMFKTMENRKSELYAQSLGIDEKYGEVISLLQGETNSRVGESSVQNVEIPTAYTQNARKFLSDISTSLKSHAKDFKEKMEEMVSTFQKFGDSWKENINGLNAQADQIVQKRTDISILLDDFSRNI